MRNRSRTVAEPKTLYVALICQLLICAQPSIKGCDFWDQIKRGEHKHPSLLSLCTLLPEPAVADISPSITVLMLVHPQNLIYQDHRISAPRPLYGAKCALGIMLSSRVFIISAINHRQPSTVQMPSVLVGIKKGLNKRMCSTLGDTHVLSHPSPGFMHPLQVGETR